MCLDVGSMVSLDLPLPVCLHWQGILVSLSQVSDVADKMKKTQEYMEHIIGNWTKIKAFEQGTLGELHRAVSAAVVQCRLYLQSTRSAPSSLHVQCTQMEAYTPTLHSVNAEGVVQQLRSGYLPVVKQITSDTPPSMGWTALYREQAVGRAGGHVSGGLS